MSIRALLLVVASAMFTIVGALLEPVGAPAAATARAAPVAGLLVTEYTADGKSRLSIVSLTGKRTPVPPRLRTLGRGWPAWRLSPDARLVAAATPDGDVLLGPVRGGVMQTVLRSPCPAQGLDGPTFAWSPDGRHLAVAAGGIGRDGKGQRSVLKIVDPSGRLVRSFTVPRRTDDWGGPIATAVSSWSPDGSRLLLERVATYASTAAVVRDIETGTSRTVARFAGCDAAHLTWSPNGRYLALDSRGTQDCLDYFELIDAVRAKTIVSREWDKGAGEGGTVWAADSKSVFGSSSTYRAGRTSSRIDRISLTGRRTNVIASRLGLVTPRVALATGLVFDVFMVGEKALYLHDFATGQRRRLAASARGFASVEPLQRLP